MKSPGRKPAVLAQPFSEDNIVTGGPGFTRRTLAFVVGAAVVMGLVFALFIFLFNQEADKIREDRTAATSTSTSRPTENQTAQAATARTATASSSAPGSRSGSGPGQEPGAMQYQHHGYNRDTSRPLNGAEFADHVSGDNSYIGMGTGGELGATPHARQMSQVSLNASSLRVAGPGGRRDVTVVPTNLSRKWEKDPSEFVSPADMSKRPIDIQVKPRYAREDKYDSVVQDDIALATKGDGQIRPVFINGKPVPRELVEDAMFRNQNFMYRTDQFPLQARPLTEDTSMKGQRSMFGKMTFPFAGLGMDVIRYRGDTRVNVASTGGRYEQ